MLLDPCLFAHVAKSAYEGQERVGVVFGGVSRGGEQQGETEHNRLRIFQMQMSHLLQWLFSLWCSWELLPEGSVTPTVCDNVT